MPAIAAVRGWFTIDDQPTLLGQRCTRCSVVAFPPTALACPNPACPGTEFRTVPLSRTGTVWSYTDAQYQPPPPYRPVEQPYRPFALAAVELAAEKMIVLGQLAQGIGVEQVQVGMAVELVVEPLYTESGVEQLIYRWRPIEGEPG